MAHELGIKRWPSARAGNAASALAAYAAAAGIEAHIFMPRDVPQANYIECKSFGAHVTLVDGLISDCGRIVTERKDKEGWFDVNTLKEPYRIEGKKTMGYEVAEQFHWKLPDAILYPTGGGVGLIGMWKAFDEMEALRLDRKERPKMIVVQADGCQPVVRAFQHGDERTSSGKTPPPFERAAGAEAARRFSHHPRRARKQRNLRRSQRPRPPRSRNPTGSPGRHLRRPRRRRLFRGAGSS